MPETSFDKNKQKKRKEILIPRVQQGLPHNVPKPTVGAPVTPVQPIQPVQPLAPVAAAPEAPVAPYDVKFNSSVSQASQDAFNRTPVSGGTRMRSNLAGKEQRYFGPQKLPGSAPAPAQLNTFTDIMREKAKRSAVRDSVAQQGLIADQQTKQAKLIQDQQQHDQTMALDAPLKTAQAQKYGTEAGILQQEQAQQAEITRLQGLVTSGTPEERKTAAEMLKEIGKVKNSGGRTQVIQTPSVTTWNAELGQFVTTPGQVMTVDPDEATSREVVPEGTQQAEPQYKTQLRSLKAANPAEFQKTITALTQRLEEIKAKDSTKYNEALEEYNDLIKGL